MGKIIFKTLIYVIELLLANNRMIADLWGEKHSVAEESNYDLRNEGLKLIMEIEEEMR